jgi:hypothetical protein
MKFLTWQSNYVEGVLRKTVYSLNGTLTISLSQNRLLVSRIFIKLFRILSFHLIGALQVKKFYITVSSIVPC